MCFLDVLCLCDGWKKADAELKNTSFFFTLIDLFSPFSLFKLQIACLIFPELLQRRNCCRSSSLAVWGGKKGQMASLLHYSLTLSVHHSSSPLIPLMPPIYLFLQSITSHHCTLLFSICLHDLAPIPTTSFCSLASFLCCWKESDAHFSLRILCRKKESTLTYSRNKKTLNWSNIFTSEIISNRCLYYCSQPLYHKRTVYLKGKSIFLIWWMLFMFSGDVLYIVLGHDLCLFSGSWLWSRGGGGEASALREDGVHLQQPPLYPHAAPVWSL